MMGMGRIETTPGSLLNGGLERWTGGLRVVPSGGHRHCINVVLRAVCLPQVVATCGDSGVWPHEFQSSCVTLADFLTSLCLGFPISDEGMIMPVVDDSITQTLLHYGHLMVPSM